MVSTLVVVPILSLSLVACAPSRYDFRDQILEPLAVQKANELAEQNRLHVRRAFEEAKRVSNDRWFPFFYWGLDALGIAGYGVPGQGRVLEKLREYYQRSSDKSRDATLNAVLTQIEEERITDTHVILDELTRQTSHEWALFGRIYSVCLDGVARRYRASGNAFRRLEDKPCTIGSSTPIRVTDLAESQDLRKGDK